MSLIAFTLSGFVAAALAAPFDAQSAELGARHEARREARPAKWCGWYMRTRHGGGPEYNLARNWSRRGVPSEPHVGAIVVWPHHVGEIVGQTASGHWVVLSGNDGGKVRARPRSLKGSIVRAL